MTNQTRRTFLTAAGSAGIASLAGCAGLEALGGDESTPTGDATPDGNGTDETTETNGSDSDGESDGESGEDELAHLPGETVADFENMDEWIAMAGQGRITAAEEDVYAGERSGLVTADADVDYAGVYRTDADGLDLSGTNLSLAVKYTGREQFDLTVQLLAPNSRNVLSFRRTLTGAPDRWQRVDLGVNDVDTQPDLQDVQEIRIIGRRRGDEDGPLEFRVDDLRAVDRPDTGAVMLLFDGTLESHYTTAFEITEEYGFPSVEAVIPETVGRDGRLTLDVMRELTDAGWEMAARPRTGAQFMHEYSPEEQEGMIRRTKAYLENRGFEDGARHFVTPKNLVGPETMDLIREYHDQAFRYGGAPNAVPATDPHNLGTLSGHAGEDTKHFVDMAARYNQLAVLRFEEIGGGGLSEDAFRDVLEYVDAQDVEVVTASDVLER